MIFIYNRIAKGGGGLFGGSTCPFVTWLVVSPTDAFHLWSRQSIQIFEDRAKASHRHVSACRMFCFSGACVPVVGGTLLLCILCLLYS